MIIMMNLDLCFCMYILKKFETEIQLVSVCIKKISTDYDGVRVFCLIESNSF